MRKEEGRDGGGEGRGEGGEGVRKGGGEGVRKGGGGSEEVKRRVREGREQEREGGERE